MPYTLPVTLYIPCFNAAHFLDRMIPAAKAQTHPLVDILLIDDGSTDGTAEVAERHGVRVIRHDANRGLGAARNTAVRAVQTEYVACLDQDVVARPDWLEILAQDLADGRFDCAGGKLHETVKVTVADRWRDAHMRQSWGEERLENPEFLYGNNGLYRTEALLKVGLYDEYLCRRAGDDVTMSKKLRDSGREILYDPRAQCDHLHADTIRSICRSYWKCVFFNEDVTDFSYLRRTGRKARKLLLRDAVRPDWRAGHYDLALQGLFMYMEWRLWDWRRFLVGGR